MTQLKWLAIFIFTLASTISTITTTITTASSYSINPNLSLSKSDSHSMIPLETVEPPQYIYEWALATVPDPIECPIDSCRTVIQSYHHLCQQTLAHPVQNPVYTLLDDPYRPVIVDPVYCSAFEPLPDPVQVSCPVVDHTTSCGPSGQCSPLSNTCQCEDFTIGPRCQGKPHVESVQLGTVSTSGAEPSFNRFLIVPSSLLLRIDYYGQDIPVFIRVLSASSLATMYEWDITLSNGVVTIPNVFATISDSSYVSIEDEHGNIFITNSQHVTPVYYDTTWELTRSYCQSRQFCYNQVIAAVAFCRACSGDQCWSIGYKDLEPKAPEDICYQLYETLEWSFRCDRTQICDSRVSFCNQVDALCHCLPGTSGPDCNKWLFPTNFNVQIGLKMNANVRTLLSSGLSSGDDDRTGFHTVNFNNNTTSINSNTIFNDDSSVITVDVQTQRVTITWSLPNPLPPSTNIDIIYSTYDPSYEFIFQDTPGETTGGLYYVVVAQHDLTTGTCTFDFPSAIPPSTTTTPGVLLLRYSIFSTNDIQDHSTVHVPYGYIANLFQVETVPIAKVQVLNYFWGQPTPWTQCLPHTCKRSTQSRDVLCHYNNLDNIVDPSFCRSIPPLIPITPERNCPLATICQNGGTCDEQNDVCICPNGVSGELCQFVDSCTNVPIKNQSKCSHHGYSPLSTSGRCLPSCVCDDNWISTDPSRVPTLLEPGCDKCSLQCDYAHTINKPVGFVIDGKEQFFTFPLGQSNDECTQCQCRRGYFGRNCQCTAMYLTLPLTSFPTYFKSLNMTISASNNRAERLSELELQTTFVDKINTLFTQVLNTNAFVSFWTLDNTKPQRGLNITLTIKGDCFNNLTLVDEFNQNFHIASTTPTIKDALYTSIESFFQNTNSLDQNSTPLFSFSPQTKIVVPVSISKHVYDPTCMDTQLSPDSTFSCSYASKSNPYTHDIPLQSPITPTPPTDPDPDPDNPGPDEEPTTPGSDKPTFTSSGLFIFMVILLVILIILSIVLGAFISFENRLCCFKNIPPTAFKKQHQREVVTREIALQDHAAQLQRQSRSNNCHKSLRNDGKVNGRVETNRQREERRQRLQEKHAKEFDADLKKGKLAAERLRQVNSDTAHPPLPTDSIVVDNDGRGSQPTKNSRRKKSNARQQKNFLHRLPSNQSSASSTSSDHSSSSSYNSSNGGDNTNTTNNPTTPRNRDQNYNQQQPQQRLERKKPKPIDVINQQNHPLGGHRPTPTSSIPPELHSILAKLPPRDRDGDLYLTEFLIQINDGNAGGGDKDIRTPTDHVNTDKPIITSTASAYSHDPTRNKPNRHINDGVARSHEPEVIIRNPMATAAQLRKLQGAKLTPNESQLIRKEEQRQSEQGYEYRK